MSLVSLMPSMETMNAFWHSNTVWSRFSYDVGHLNKKLIAFQRTWVYCQYWNYFIMLRNVFVWAMKVFNWICYTKKLFSEKKVEVFNKKQILRCTNPLNQIPIFCSSTIWARSNRGLQTFCQANTASMYTHAWKSAEGGTLGVLMDLEFSKALEIASHEILPSD